MTTGPNGEKRSKSPVTSAVQVAKVATGESDEKPARRIVFTVTKKPAD